MTIALFEVRGFPRTLSAALVIGILWIAVTCQGCNPTPPPTPANPPPPVERPHPPQATEPKAKVPAILPDFENVANTLGIDAPFFTDIVAERYYLPEIMGGGATWLDFDRDGHLDLYLTNGTRFEPGTDELPRGNWLYRGRPGTRFQLVEESIGAGDRGYGQGSAAGDFNADGFPDLYVGNVGPNALYVNEGDGTFTKDETSPNLADPAWTSSVLWLDLNRDGLLDLYVTNYLEMTLRDRKVCEYDGKPGYCGPGQYPSAPDHVFLNQGDGRFVESSNELGMTDTFGKGLAVLGADLNQDGVPEVYVGNDMTPNFLYTTDRGDANLVRYRDEASTGGAAQSGEGMNEASMGISCADFDGDHLPDLFLTHYYNMQDTLYRNHGGLQFEDVSRRMKTAQVGFPYLGFGTVPIDFDGDGFDDLFITNGHVLGPSVKPDRMPPQWLYNAGGRFFEDITGHLSGYARQEWLGRGAASADFDDDGDLDIAVTHLNDPAALLRNTTRTGRSFVGFELATLDRMVPCGSRVTITTSGGQSMRSVKVGGSYLSSSDERLLFLIDPKEQHVNVRIEWSSGDIDEYTKLDVNRYWHCQEGRQPW